MRKYLCLLFVIVNHCLCDGWDGYDWQVGEYIEIDKGNLVRKGLDIEVYHSSNGEYHEEEVVSVNTNELETYDYTTGEYRSYDMD